MYLTKTLLLLIIPLIIFCSSLEARAPVSTVTAPAGTICPTIQISSDAPGNVVCSGSGIPVNFTATITGPAGGLPDYQWQVNGNPAPGASSISVYSSTTLSDGDIVTCFYSDNSCVAPGSNVSNAITIKVIAPVTPSVIIASDALTICSGSPSTFTATPVNGGTAPVYQWQVNGSLAPGSTNSATYTSSGLNDNDVIRCLLTSNASCLTTTSAYSNSFSMSVNKSLVSTVTLSSTPSPICAGDKVDFTATPTNEGTAPDYVWQVNGNPAPGAANSPAYSSSVLVDGDVVSVGLSDAVGCVISSSDQASVTVNPLPTVADGQLIVLSKGESVTLELVTTGTIASYLWSPVTGLSDATIATPVATPPGTTTYTLLVTTPAGCRASGSVLVKVFSDLRIPSAFTPNGDGHNDVFFVIGGPKGSQIKDFVVFDRWGQRVFQVQGVLPDDRNFGWNGRVNGNDAPAGAYVYQIRMGFADGTQQVYKGTVLLVR